MLCNPMDVGSVSDVVVFVGVVSKRHRLLSFLFFPVFFFFFFFFNANMKTHDFIPSLAIFHHVLCPPWQDGNHAIPFCHADAVKTRNKNRPPTTTTTNNNTRHRQNNNNDNNSHTSPNALRDIGRCANTCLDRTGRTCP